MFLPLKVLRPDVQDQPLGIYLPGSLSINDSFWTFKLSKESESPRRKDSNSSKSGKPGKPHLRGYLESCSCLIHRHCFKIKYMKSWTNICIQDGSDSCASLASVTITAGELKPVVIAPQAGSWTVTAQDRRSHHPATCPLVLGWECVWVRPWPRWSSSSSCPGSCSASLCPSHQATVCPVWRESSEWSCSQPSTRWTPQSDQTGQDTSARQNSPVAVNTCAPSRRKASSQLWTLLCDMKS